MKKYLTPGAAMRKLLSVTALAAIAVIAFTATAEAKTRTTLTTDGVFYTPHPSTLFSGDVISVKKACANKRLVIVFRKRPGADQKIGATRSKPGLVVRNQFFWTLEKRGMLPKGTYYAVTRATDRCSGARSTGYAGPS